jgi:thiol:disulfide interchange protein DsbD
MNPVKWTYTVVQTNPSTAELVFTAKIDKGWHLYSQYMDEGGPIVTSFVFTAGKTYKLDGKTIEPKPKAEYDEMFKMTVKYFANQAVFKQKIKVLSNKDFSIKGSFEYMVCNDGSCIPFSDNTFEFKVKGNPGGENITAATDTNKTTTQAKATVSNEDSTKIKTENSNKAKTDIIGDQKKEDDNTSLWLFFWLSFGGGLIGLLTPCVFPMIPMTVSFFMKSGSKGKVQALIYGASIVAIYTLFGTLLAVIFGENFGNIISTHWIPNLLFAGIFIVFAISLFGYFEITLPSWLINKSVQNEEKGDYIGPVFMALTLVLVSFSCTLPIAGTVAINAVKGEIIRPIIGMLGFSLAFAIPFTFFAFFPKWLHNLPKSGGWLNTVKVVLAFVELAFALKFLNVPDQTYHWRLLDREVYLAIWIVIFAMLGFYLMGKIKFPHDDDTPVMKSWFRLFLAITTFSFVIYMIPGMWGAPLKSLSGWLPPMETQDFDFNSIIRDNASTVSIDNKQNELCDAPKYADNLHLPLGLKGYFDYDQALKCAKAQNKPVFIDFTGHGCTNCRKMENQVWSDPKVLELLKNKFIVTALYVDDKIIDLPKEEYIKDKNGNDITKLGKKNAFIQINKFNGNSQPYYVLLNPDGEVLVNPKAYDLDIQNFIKFLNDGLAAFDKQAKK